MIHYATYIKIDRDSPTPIYQQVANQLADSIYYQYIPDKQKLPGARKLAEMLGVHRHTITAAYELLESQGWVVSERGRGTTVRLQALHQAGQEPSQEASQKRSKAGFAFKSWTLMDHVVGQSLAAIRMDDGVPDVRLSQLHDLTRLFHTNMKRKGTLQKLRADNPLAHQYFTEQLTSYLNMTRGLGVDESHVMVCRSMELGLNIVAETLLEPHDIVLVGELSYFGANMILQKTGATVMTVPVDDQGLQPAAIRRLCERNRVRMLYVMPHFHYPTTVTMSLERRREILGLAAEFGFIVVEDDYDFDFHYDRSPELSMAAMDGAGMVLYIGTFGKFMPTAFRAGYVVGPADLILEMKKLHAVMDRYGDPIRELAMGELIADRHIFRYVRANRVEYRQRRDVFAQELAKNLGHVLDLVVPEGGLGMWTRWPPGINLMKFSRACSREGLLIPPYLLYQHREMSGIRMGFGSLMPEEISSAVQIIQSVYKSGNI